MPKPLAWSLQHQRAVQSLYISGPLHGYCTYSTVCELSLGFTQVLFHSEMHAHEILIFKLSFAQVS
jgi:hypothetical protein